ncbi:MAG: ABC transporter ATP-binding protein [Candidatus Methanomethylicia archaeon]
MIVVELRNITKIYPGGIVANNNVNFDLKKGEIHVLLGENGAGKTTLMKIMSGCLTPNKGSIIVNGRNVFFKSSMDALKHGIGMVHQNFTLIPTMTALENIKLGLMDKKIKVDDLVRDVENIFSKLSFPRIDLNSPVYMLSTGEKQKIEITRLLLRGVKVLILDEPTSMLCGFEADKFLDLLRLLTLEGCSVVFTTHKIREAMKVSDRITVMKNGRVITTLKREDVKSEDDLVKLMIGEKIEMKTVKHEVQFDGTPLLLVRNLVVADDQGVVKVKNISLELHRGEILGIAGVEGNGQKELVEAIIGFKKPLSGELIINGDLRYIPSERELGVAQSLSVLVNSIIRSLNDMDFKGKWGTINMSGVKKFSEEIISFMNMNIPSLNMLVKHLSGGNIVRLIVGREILKTREILIAEQPTAGLDVRSAYLVRRNLIELASRGVGILLVSSDLDEIMELSDRIAVIRNGEIVKVFSRNEADPKLIGAYMLE